MREIFVLHDRNFRKLPKTSEGNQKCPKMFLRLFQKHFQSYAKDDNLSMFWLGHKMIIDEFFWPLSAILYALKTIIAIKWGGK